jgi:hypothetical protein
MRLVGICAGLAALAAAALPARATTYTPGEFVTFEASVWGAAPDGFNAGTVLENNFDTVYPNASSGEGGYLAVGVPTATALLGLFDPNPPFSLIFIDGANVNGFLGLASDTLDARPPSSLHENEHDPILDNASEIPGGVLSTDAIALTLNVDYSDDGLLAHPDGVAFGDLVFQNLDSLVGKSVTLPEGFFSPFVLSSDVALLDGFSVRQVLTEADLLLSGEKSFASQFNPLDLDYIVFLADTAFNEGLLNLGAQYLAFPTAADGGAPAAPEPSTWAMLLIGFMGLGLAGWRGRPLREGEARRLRAMTTAR